MNDASPVRFLDKPATGKRDAVNVLVLHSVPPPDPGNGRRVWEFDLSAAATEIQNVLPGAAIAGVRGEAGEIIALLEAHQPDVVFNLCEAPLGRTDREVHVAALLEWLGVRFTGARSETLALCRRKDRVMAVLAAAGVPVPRAGVFPTIVKPADEHGSAGLSDDSICRNDTEVAAATSRWKGPVIVQEYLPGREFCVALWGLESPEHESVGETCFQAGLRLNTYAGKWDVDSADYANSPLSYRSELAPPLHDAIRSAARRAWCAVNAHGYLRVDVRLDAAGLPRVIDVNANPEMSPEVGMHRAVCEAGWTWAQFVQRQIEWAI